MNPINICPGSSVDADTKRSFNCCNDWECQSACCLPFLKRKRKKKTQEVQKQDEKIHKVASTRVHGHSKSKRPHFKDALEPSEDDPDEIFFVDKK